jgi:hypothetical protein
MSEAALGCREDGCLGLRRNAALRVGRSAMKTTATPSDMARHAYCREPLHDAHACAARARPPPSVRERLELQHVFVLSTAEGRLSMARVATWIWPR